MIQSEQSPCLELSRNDWEEVRRILTKCVPGYEVWAFGSRVKGTAKPYSDLDLVIVTDQPLPLEITAELNESFAESDLTIKVDVVDWAMASASFRRIIQENKVVVQESLGT